MTQPLETSSQVSHTDLDRVLDRACAGLGVRSVFQPIVDLGSSQIVGHESLLRIDGLHDSHVAPLFERAAQLGSSDALEAAAMGVALAQRPATSAGFLALNVTASSLLNGEIESTLRNRGSLDGVVFEINGGRLDELSEIRDRYQPRGARFSLDDDAISYDDLRRLMALRPTYVKLDRRHFANAAHDEAAQMFVEAASMVASRVGAELVAEGIEHPSELQSLRSAGIGLGQGYLLGRPGSMPSALELVKLAHQAEKADVSGETDSALALLIEAAVTISESELPLLRPALAEHILGFAVLVNDHGEPLALLRRKGTGVATVPISVTPLSGSVRHAGRVALARPSITRFEPMVVIDDLGRFVGVLRLERILAWLANDPEPTRPVVPAPINGPRRRTRRRHRRGF
jgi:EAL domain-containing protein (putative c-di-GMP-specific phosphodiesterase class I)